MEEDEEKKERKIQEKLALGGDSFSKKPWKEREEVGGGCVHGKEERGEKFSPRFWLDYNINVNE